MRPSLLMRVVQVIATSIVLLGANGGIAQVVDVSVAQTGGASYAYPIKVPPGIGGMAPRLALAYSSGGINGPVGVGWSVQGVSVISRCSASVATDGFRRGVQYLPSDKLCIDGQRLIQTDALGNPLSTQTDDARGLSSGYREYRTEIDSFARIRAYGIAGGADTNGPAYFRVWTKAGEIYDYGNTPDSSFTVSISTVVAAWSANQVTDTVGNAIQFQYEQRSVSSGSGSSSGVNVGKELNLSQVLYTVHGSQAAANKVVFTYVDRSDRAEAYHLGAKNVSVRILDSVRTYTNVVSSPIEVTAYKLTMGLGTVGQRNRLLQITECSGASEAKCFPPTKFAYSAGGNEAYIAAAGFNLNGTRLFKQDGSYGVLLGDFDGDGKVDMIRWSNTPSENILYFSRPTSSGALGTPDNVAFAASSNFNITDRNLNHSNGCTFSVVADFDGDGRSDILRWASPDGYDINGNQTCVADSSYLYLSRGDGSFSIIQLPSSLVLSRKLNKTTPCDLSKYWQCASSGGSNFYVGDFNGDGRADIVVSNILARPSVLKSQDPPPANQFNCVNLAGDPVECTFVYRGNGDGTFTKLTTNISSRSVYTDPNGANAGNKRLLLDVNGDGLQDILHPVTSMRLISSGDGNFTALPTGTNTGACLSNALDVNGDGKPDFVCASTLLIGLGDGTFFLSSQFNLGGTGTEVFAVNGNLQQIIGVVPADVDGDGRSDLIRWEDTASSNALYLSNGDGSFRQSSTFNFTNVQLRSSTGTSDFVVSDFSGRGNAEILRLADDNTNQLYVKADATPPDLLVSVTTPLGAVSQLTYGSIARAGAPYVSGRAVGDPIANSTYPKAILQFADYVVTSLSRDGGSAGNVVSDYQYRALTASADGRGLLGFASMVEDFPGLSGAYLTKTTSFSTNFPYIGLPLQSNTRTGSASGTGIALSQTVTSYCDARASSGCVATALVRQPFAQQVVESGSDLNGVALPTVTTTNAFDTDGNATQIVVQTAGSVGGVAQTFTKTSTNTYLAANKSGDAWIIGRLQRATVADAVPDDVLAVSAGTSPNATRSQGVLAPLGVTTTPSSVAKSQTSAGTLTASVTVAIANGTAPYVYSWVHTSGTVVTESGTSVATFSATLSSGQSVSESFTVTVTDAAGRTGSALVPVAFSVSAPLTVSLSPSSLSASRNNPGAISATTTVSPTGGTAPYTYSWARLTGSRITESGAQSATFSATLGWGENLTESYRVTVTDAASQTKTADITITFTSPPALALAVSPTSLNTPVNNPGTATASASLTASGGVSPYTYAWSRLTGSRISESGTQSATFSVSLGWSENLTESFRATVTDAASNTTTQDLSVTFTTPPQLVASINPSALNTAASNAGAASAYANVVASGGVGTLSYAWSRLTGSRITVSGGQAATFSVNLGYSENLTESFRVTVSDQAGHSTTADLNVTFTSPPALSVSVSPTSISQTKSSANSVGFSGSASVSVSNGSGSYTYSWQSSNTDFAISGGQTATFTVVVDCGLTDTSTETVTVVESSTGRTGTASLPISFRNSRPSGGCSGA